VPGPYDTPEVSEDDGAEMDGGDVRMNEGGRGGRRDRELNDSSRDQSMKRSYSEEERGYEVDYLDTRRSPLRKSPFAATGVGSRGSDYDLRSEEIDRFVNYFL